MAIKLKVVDGRGFPIGEVTLKAGLRTSSGPVVRWTEKSVWTLRKDGSERLHRDYDGRLPTVAKSNAPRSALFEKDR